ncbi:Hvo_1808 family surface protein [Halovenus aranensis]|uniref:Hvo_1808 family surface protein n=1 Tax=Halovenus aranensis TaxID=890420 RepID=UPI00159FFCC9|nr:Hvo_1808 family surface protein [Halovenus aranensis]
MADDTAQANDTIPGTVVENDTADPESDRLGWENGVWANATLSITQSDGINETELDAVVARTMARVEAVRGIEFDRTPPVRILLPREQRAESEQLQYADVQRTRLNATYEALFLINETESAVDSKQALRGNGVNGYYSPETGNVTMVSPNSSVPQIREGVLAQELFHAQQDAQFDLPEVRTIEQRNARNGYVEGDANYVQDRYEQRCGETWTCYRPERESYPDLSGVDDGMMTLFRQPYQSGYAFVRDRHQESGWEAVDELYENPPESTEQVIHPEKYGADTPTNVRVRDRSSAAWQPLTVDGVQFTQSVGEAGLYVALLSPLQETAGRRAIIPLDNHRVGGLGDAVTRSYDHPATAGWDGDKLLPYTAAEGNATGYVYETAWDSPEDAREFHDAYRKLLAYHGAEPVVGKSDTYRIPESSGFADAIYLNRTGDRLRIVNAPSVDALSEIRAGAAPPASGPDGQWSHLLWKADLDADRLTDPVAVEGTVSVYDGDAIYGIDRDEGSLLWTKAVNESIVADVTAADGTIYAGTFDSTVLAVDATTGEQQWTSQVDDRMVTAPAVADGTTYVTTTAGTLYALNATTGEQRWRTQLNGTTRSIQVVGDTVLTRNLTTHFGVDTQTGTIEWSVPSSGRLLAPPVASDGTVYTGSFNRTRDTSSLSAVNPATGETRWREERNGSAPTRLVVTDEMVYANAFNTSDQSGQLLAIERASGKQRWTVEFERPVTATAVDNGTLYAGTAGGELRAIEGTTGDEKWTVDADGAVNAPLVVANETLYAGTKAGTLTALATTTGEQRWAVFADGLASISPTLVDGAVYARAAPSLYAVEMPATEGSTDTGAGDAAGDGGTDETSDETPAENSESTPDETEREPTATSPQDTQTASEDGSGFGIVAAVVALGLIAVARSRR